MKITFTELACAQMRPKGFMRRNKILFLMRVGILNVVLLGVSLLLNANATTGQNLDEITVTIGAKNESLEAILEQIKEKTKLHIGFLSKQVEPYDNISLPAERRSVRETLDLVLNGTSLTYRQEKAFIFIERNDSDQQKKSDRNLTSLFTADESSFFTITGTVREAEQDQPMAGVNVVVKGTTRGTSTDANGRYSIDVEQNETLVFSFIGYQTFEIQVGTQTNIDVRLDQDIEALKEVVIDAGYYKTTNRTKTGNIAKIENEVIERQPVANTLQAMQGRMTGVFIQQSSNVPGGAFSIQIRGQNSLRTSINDNGNYPLYIIDGVPFPAQTLGQLTQGGADVIFNTNPLNAINPNDIESIEVLKDADATAIYGSRGANGVILISTKKAHKGKAKFDVNVSTGVGAIPKKIDLLNTRQYNQMRMEAVVHDGYKDFLVPAYANFFPDIIVWDTTRYTDWQEVLLGGTAKTTSAQASVSSGNENIQFLFSGNFFRETTIFPGDFAFQRGSGHMNLNYLTDSKKFNLNFSSTYTLSNNTLPSQNYAFAAITLPPNAPKLYDEEGKLNWENGTWYNPYADLEREYNARTNSLITNLGLSYQILPSIVLKTNIGYSNLLYKELRKVPIKSQNPTAPSPPANVTHFADNTDRTLNIEPILEYKQSLLNGTLTTLIGFTYNEIVREGQVIVASGFSTEALMEDISSANNITGSASFSHYRYNAIFGRINYNWGKRYLINLTARRDGSSRFGSGNKFGNFGAVGAAWIFSEEDFIKGGFPILSFGKIRASYGITGNDQIGDYGYFDSYESSPYPYQVAGLHPTRIPNPNYGWEENRKLEAAIELGFGENRVMFSASAYRNRSSNQLVGYPLPEMSGFPVVQANLPATVQNSGLEIELSTINIETDQFTWTTDFNITLPKNKLINFPNKDLTSYSNLIIGERIKINKGYAFKGVDAATGLYTFQDTDESGTITPEDGKKVLDIPQQFYGGINNSFKFREFQLDIFFQFVRQTSFDYRSLFVSPGNIGNQPVEVMGRWRIPGDITDVQKFSTSPAAGNNHNRWLFSDNNFNDNMSFIRLKNVSLSWALPFAWTSKLKLQSSRIYVHGQNLLTFTKYKGPDPESISAPLRVITVGVKFTL